MKVSFGELFYYLFWSLMLFVKGVGWYDGMPVYKICFLLAVFCIGMKLCLTEHTVAEWLFIMIISVLGLVAYMNSREKGILLGIMMLIGMKGIPMERLFKIGLVVWGSCFFAMNVLGVFDLVTGPVFAQDKNMIGVVFRKSLGYPHPNVLHVSYAVLVVFILYLYQQKDIRKYLFLFLGSVYIFLYSFSYTGLLLVVIFLGMDFYLSRRKKISNVESILLQCMLPACMIFSVAGPVVIPQDSRLFTLINKIMNVRFFASKVFMVQNPLSILGSRNRTEGWALDSSYVSLLLHYGILFFVLFFVLYFAAVRNSIRQDDRKGLTIMVSFIIAGVMEPFLVNTSFKNLAWLFVGKYLFDTFFMHPLWINGGIINKRIILFGRSAGKVKVPMMDAALFFTAVKNVKSQWKKISFFTAILLGISTAALFFVNSNVQEDIYIGVQNADIGDQKEYYLDVDHLPEDFRGKIYEYMDPETPLYKLEREQIGFEPVRKSISIGIIACGIVYCLLLMSFLVLKSNPVLDDIYVKYKWRMRKVQYGDENPDRTFYIVRRSPCKIGLLSHVMTNMGHVRYALEQGYIPVIDMRTSNSYLEEKEVGKINAWELFFEQPCGYSLEDIKKSKNVILSNGIIGRKIPYPSMKLTQDENDCQQWRDIFHKYFKLKREIEKEVTGQYDRLFSGEKVLGVLCRGTDYANNRPSRHPVQPEITDLMDQVSRVFEERQCKYIYLATEDEEVYQKFRMRFQDKLVVTDARRFQNTGSRNINDVIEEESVSKYIQGKDYLINIALLSRCSCLVAGCTGGTYGALLMSRGYEYQYVFDLGLYET